MAKPIVIDANVTLGLFLRLPYSEKVDRWMQTWQAQEVHNHLALETTPLQRVEESAVSFPWYNRTNGPDASVSSL